MSNAALIVGLVVGFALTVAVLKALSEVRHQQRRRPLSHHQPQALPERKSELGMEAIDMEMVEAVERKNRRLAAKNGSGGQHHDWTTTHADIRKLKNSGDTR